MTSNLEKRVIAHHNGEIDGFTKKYNVKNLVYCEEFGDIREAITRKKQLKKWRRDKKIELIHKINPKWIDLSRLTFK